MSNKKYSDIVGVRQNFDDTFDLTSEKKNSWKSFITNSQFEKNLKSIITSFTAPKSTDLTKRKSIWVQGTYGTGKSHSTSVVKHLLCDDVEDIQDFVNSISDKQLRKEILNFRKDEKCFPVVMKGRYTISDVKDMSYQIQVQTRKALADADISVDIATDYDQALLFLDNKMYSSFWETLLDGELKMYCKTTKDIEKELKQHNKDILRIIDQSLKNTINASFGTTSITAWLCNVQRELKKQKKADYLLLIWDEFTSMLSGDESRSILNTVQDIAELSKDLNENEEPKGVYILLVTHKMLEQTEAFRSRDIEEQKLALDRFVSCKYEMQPNTTYHILSSTIDRKDEDTLNTLIDERIVNDFAVSSVIDRITEDVTGNIEEIREKIISLYPFHPYTAYLSTFVSRQLGAAERSIFNFMNDDKVGFKHFITNTIDEKNKFLLPNSIWDFYLGINTGNESAKLSEIISKYNMHLDQVKKKGSVYLKIFKTILLLNSLNSVVDVGEDVNERSMVVPNEKNICDCYSGVIDSDKIKEILEYLDQNNIVIKSPDGLYEVSTATISNSELSNYKKNACKKFYEITAYFEENPICISDFCDAVAKNNGRIVRKVEVIPLSSVLKNTQIETKLGSYITNKYSIYVVMFFSHGECESLKEFTQERKSADLMNNLVNMSKRDEYNNVVFCNVDTELTEQEFDRFIDSYARGEVLGRTSPADAKNAKNNAANRIKAWLRKIENEGVIEYAFQGNKDIGTLNQLSTKICDKYIPFVFPSGLDILKSARKEPVWKESNSKTVIQSFLYQSNRDDLEDKLRNGSPVNLRCLLKDDKDNYIFDENLNLQNKASKKHPIVELDRKISEVLEEKKKDNIIDLKDSLSFIFQPPFGYYRNQISLAAVSLVMKKYVDKMFREGSGIKIDKTGMADIVEALFKQTSSRNLSVRFSSKEELELIDLFNKVFNTSGEGLNDIRWSLRDEIFGKQCNCPIWTLKYIDEDINPGFEKAIEDVFHFSINADSSISQSEIVEVYSDLDKYQTEFSLAFDKIKNGKIDLLGDRIRSIVKGINQDTELSDEEVKEYRAFIDQNMQEAMPFWKEENVIANTTTYYYKKFAENHIQNQPDNPTSNDEQHKENDTVDISDKEISTSVIEKAKKYILECNKNQDELKNMLVEIIDRYPEIGDWINKIYGES